MREPQVPLPESPALLRQQHQDGSLSKYAPSSGRVAVEALAARKPSRRLARATRRDLPRSVHLPIQPASIERAPPARLPAGAKQRRGAQDALLGDRPSP